MPHSSSVTTALPTARIYSECFHFCAGERYETNNFYSILALPVGKDIQVVFPTESGSVGKEVQDEDGYLW
jgi:hypothetical protein